MGEEDTVEAANASMTDLTLDTSETLRLEDQLLNWREHDDLPARSYRILCAYLLHAPGRDELRGRLFAAAFDAGRLGDGYGERTWSSE